MCENNNKCNNRLEMFCFSFRPQEQAAQEALKITSFCRWVECHSSWVSVLLVIQKVFFFVTVYWAREDLKVHSWLREKIRELIPSLFSLCSLILTSRIISLWLPCLWQLLLPFLLLPLSLSYFVVWHVSSSSSAVGPRAHAHTLWRTHRHAGVAHTQRARRTAPFLIEVKWVHQHLQWIIELSGSVQK